MAIAFRDVALGNGGTGNVTVTWPTHATDDIGILMIESTGGQAANLTTAAGFVAITNSPQSTGSGTAGTRVTAYWVRCTSASMTSPVVTDPGNHAIATIISFSGCIKTGNPWDVTNGSVKASASTSATLSAVTTTVPNTMIVYLVTADITGSTAWTTSVTNGNLTSITNRYDDRAASGNGGGLAIYTGVRANPGDISTASLSCTSSINAFMTIALKPPATTRSWTPGFIGY